MNYRQSRDGAEGAVNFKVRPKEQGLRITEGKDDEGLEGTRSMPSRISKRRRVGPDKCDQTTDSASDTSTRLLPSQNYRAAVPPVAYTAPIPMEIVEIIIDNVDGGATFLACSLVCREWLARCRYYLFSRICTPAASCASLIQVLDPAKLMAPLGSTGKAAEPQVSSLPPAGIFIQSLVITPSSDQLLSLNSSVDPRHNASLAAKLLIESAPNIRELQLTGVTEWALSHFLDPVSKTKKLEGLVLVDIRCRAWSEIATSLATCAPTLKSLRISGLRFRAPLNLGDTAAAPTSTSSSQQQIYLPLLKILSIEMEHQDSHFVGELLDNLMKGPSESLEKLEVLELPIEMVSRSQTCLKRVSGSLQSITVYCDKLTTDPNGLGPESYALDLGALSQLKNLHFSIHAHWDHGAPSLAALRTLVNSLSSFPYSTLNCLRLTFRAALGYPPYTDDQWKELDDALSLPHLAGLERVELDGIGSFIAMVKRGLPNSFARGVLHFLW